LRGDFTECGKVKSKSSKSVFVDVSRASNDTLLVSLAVELRIILHLFSNHAINNVLGSFGAFLNAGTSGKDVSDSFKVSRLNLVDGFLVGGVLRPVEVRVVRGGGRVDKTATVTIAVPAHGKNFRISLGHAPHGGHNEAHNEGNEKEAARYVSAAAVSNGTVLEILALLLELLLVLIGIDVVLFAWHYRCRNAKFKL
jgi:hypothetical protein